LVCLNGDGTVESWKCRARLSPVFRLPMAQISPVPSSLIDAGLYQRGRTNGPTATSARPTALSAWAPSVAWNPSSAPLMSGEIHKAVRSSVPGRILPSGGAPSCSKPPASLQHTARESRRSSERPIVSARSSGFFINRTPSSTPPSRGTPLTFE